MDDNDGIEDDHSVPPWERPGCFRRDCEPHRGDFLNSLGTASLIAGGLALVSGGLLIVVCLPLVVLTLTLVRQDLAKMRRGLMDPNGEYFARGARRLAWIGLLLGALGVAFAGAMLLSAFLMRV